MKKQKITQQDYLKAHRKASREEEIARHGRPARFRAVHKSKKAYDRKREKAGLRNLPFSFHIKIESQHPLFGFADIPNGLTFSTVFDFRCRKKARTQAPLQLYGHLKTPNNSLKIN